MKTIHIDRLFLNDLVILLDTLDQAELSFLDTTSMLARLQKVQDNPQKFLSLQQEVYKRKILLEKSTLKDYLQTKGFIITKEESKKQNLLYSIKRINKPQRGTRDKKNDIQSIIGLPQKTASYYDHFTSKNNYRGFSNETPRILNIGSGGPNRHIYGYNLDALEENLPQIVGNGDSIPFPDEFFIVVRASHVLEHIDSTAIAAVLKEWLRVLDKNGELHIAVPDAKIVLKELRKKITTNGTKSYSLTTTTPTIAQIYGVGYESKKTNRSWRHTMLLNTHSLNHLLTRHLQLHTIKSISRHEDLAALHNVKDDSQNRYSFTMIARKEHIPHPTPQICNADTFKEKYRRFIRQHRSTKLPPLSIIIPIHNEERNLPSFLRAFNSTLETLPPKLTTEILFVLSVSTDKSEQIIKDYQNKHLNKKIRLIKSKKGILNAFVQGIKKRSYDGMVCKIDADTIPHPYSLILQYIFLTESRSCKVTYADPVYTNKRNIINFGDYYSELRSQRLYIHGRCSMYKENPFSLFSLKQIFNTNTIVEDIVLSYAYIFYYGFKSVQLTPGAIIYCKTPSTLSDILLASKRTQAELKKIETAFPYLKVVTRLMKRELLHPLRGEAFPYSKKVKLTLAYVISRIFSILSQNQFYTTKTSWKVLKSTK